MTIDDAPASAAPALPPRFRWRRRVAWLVGALLVAVLLIVVSAGSGLWWAVRSDSGTAWLFSRVPGLKISGGKGTLWGDFEAAQVEFRLPGGGKVLLDDVAWRGLRVEHAPWMAYRARVVIDALSARRVEVQLPSDSKKEPARQPAHLRAPVELDVAALRIGELHLAALGDKPLRDLQARVHFGAQRGSRHQVEDLRLAWDKLKARGSAGIATDAPFGLQVQTELTQDAAADATAWRAQAALAGPLAQPLLTATVRAQPAGGRPAQSLDLRAGLRPFAAWPLGELQARTQALDLSALLANAPVTSLSGDAQAQTTALDQPATLSARLANAEAGRWNEGRLPLRTLSLDARARPNDPRTLDLQTFAAELGTKQQAAGRLQGHGRWTPGRWDLDLHLEELQPSQLDARAPTMRLSGPLTAHGTDFDRGIDAATLELKADFAGQFTAAGAARSATVKLDAAGSLKRIDLREARAAAGSARATLTALATRDTATAPWQLKGSGTLVDFDPAPWWPGREGTPLRKGPNRLNASSEFDLSVPIAQAGVPWVDQLAAIRGKAHVGIAKSVLAGVPLTADAALRGDGGGVQASLKLDAAGNSVSADGRLGTGRQAASDQWKLVLTAPALDQLAPLWQTAPTPAGEAALAGSAKGSATIAGRWPAIATQGELEASGLRVGQTRVQQAQARWQVDARGSGAADAVVDVQASLAQLAFSQALFKGTPPIESATLQARGTMRAHSVELHAETKALPPAWTDAFQPRPAGPAAAASAPAPASRSVGVFSARGAAIGGPTARDAPAPWTGWRGQIQQIELRSTLPDALPWLRTRDVGLELQWAGGPMRLAVQPGRAEVLGAALRWNRVAWQAGADNRPAQIEAQAELEPLPVAPLLARFQPDFGWGGDLTVVGRLDLRSAPAFSADVVLERQRGDLVVTDETGKTQALGLSDLRLGLHVDNGVWSFTQGLAGSTLGVAAGAVIARTSPQNTWPPPDTPIQGVLEVQVANLGTWGPWLPAGWRLNGALRTSAGIAGRFNAPEYTGEVRGSGIGVRNFLLGVNVSDGDVAVLLQGPTARIERFSARAGAGTVRLEGNASLGEAPKAVLKLQADRFQLLGRVDRRIVTTGRAEMQLDRETLALDGKFVIDEGLIDFSRSDAPRLSDDVVVVRRNSNGSGTSPTAEPQAPSPNPAPEHTVKLNLEVDLGSALHLRGRGIDTDLRGALHITSPGNHLALNGTVAAVNGTYAAYGQKLSIDRGRIIFNGPAENPRLDIEATRPNLDVRVGVIVSGTALDPRVRLFSEPEMAEMDKLSWLVLGRGGDSLGRTDTALLQRAAMALLAGEGGGATDQFTKALGLDEVSLRQTDGEVRETVISLGKQISQRWYVGYERSLTATTGNWQLIYRIARRFTLRAQAGADSSLDVIWTWRWQ
ncbi:translocation/assembly module TamB domain-containing protein [Piscinibacter sp. XHJ-5]|uniref:translocation/assembly module TamB domain-containing protein n=1 Tax=Piscinibacter sp. XHJ-5 TaxID=3037797 RepID=UPI0024531A93|nr:translocation/assembly module TamB domain-containing protein [Piscinibacter sp. XHJ-5]